MADDDLLAEQRHLDRTWAAYEAVLRELFGERTSGIDEFALEALELMRREHLRRYTESSGPLYFGRIDETSGRSLHIGRHAIADEHNELLAINWRAPAAEPFYAATPVDRRGVVRRRRLDIEERRVLGLVDEDARRGGRRRRPDRIDHRGHHAPARGRDAADHLHDHARAVARGRAGTAAGGPRIR